MSTMTNEIKATTHILTEMECDTFIIPNHAGVIKDYWSGQDRLRKRTEEICSINGVTVDVEKEHLLQLWMTNEKFENMNDHHFRIDHDGWTYSFRLDSVLPASFFAGKKEGEVIDIIIPLNPNMRTKIYPDDANISFKDKEREWFDDEDIEGVTPEFIITFHIKLNQRGYRYRSFGNFEDVYERVVY